MSVQQVHYGIQYANETVDMIVNSVGVKTTEMGKLCKDIYFNSNKIEFGEFLKSIENKAEVGNMYLTDSMGLKCQHILHVITPFQIIDNKFEQIKNMYISIFKVAVEQCYKKITIPVIGTGANGYNYAVVKKILCEIAEFYSDLYPDLEIHLILNYRAKREQVIEAWEIDNAILSSVLATKVFRVSKYDISNCKLNYLDNNLIKSNYKYIKPDEHYLDHMQFNQEMIHDHYYRVNQSAYVLDKCVVAPEKQPPMITYDHPNMSFSDFIDKYIDFLFFDELNSTEEKPDRKYIVNKYLGCCYSTFGSTAQKKGKDVIDSLSKKENGVYKKPTKQQLIRLALALRMPLDYFIFEVLEKLGYEFDNSKSDEIARECLREGLYESDLIKDILKQFCPEENFFYSKKGYNDLLFIDSSYVEELIEEIGFVGEQMKTQDLLIKKYTTNESIWESKKLSKEIKITLDNIDDAFQKSQKVKSFVTSKNYNLLTTEITKAKEKYKQLEEQRLNKLRLAV